MKPGKILAAIGQLDRSDRGRMVLRHVCDMAENGLTGLDSANRTAFWVILSSLFDGPTGTAIDCLAAWNEGKT